MLMRQHENSHAYGRHIKQDMKGRCQEYFCHGLSMPLEKYHNHQQQICWQSLSVKTSVSEHLPIKKENVLDFLLLF